MKDQTTEERKTEETVG